MTQTSLAVGGQDAPVGRRAVQVEPVAFAAVGGRQHDRGAVDDHAQVADQARVEDRVQVAAVGPAALLVPVQGGLRWVDRGMARSDGRWWMAESQCS